MGGQTIHTRTMNHLSMNYELINFCNRPHTLSCKFMPQVSFNRALIRIRQINYACLSIFNSVSNPCKFMPKVSRVNSCLSFCFLTLSFHPVILSIYAIGKTKMIDQKQPNYAKRTQFPKDQNERNFC